MIFLIESRPTEDIEAFAQYVDNIHWEVWWKIATSINEQFK